MKLNYSKKGNGQPIILLHGWGGSINSLDKLQTLLASEGYEVYNLDLPGFGESEKPKQPLVVDDYVEFLHRFITELKINKPILLGHSFGGKTAMKYCLTHKNRPLRLILVNSSGINPKNSFKKSMFLIPSKIFGAIFSLPILNKLKPILRKAYYILLVGERDYLKADPIMQKTMSNVVTDHLDIKIPSIKQPSLVIWGKEDKQTPIWMGEKIANMLPNSRFEIVQGATHGLPLKNPEIITRLVKNFLG